MSTEIKGVSVSDFEKNFDKSNWCWIWRGVIHKGVCQAYYKKNSVGKYMGAHRMAYMLYIGDIPSGMFVSRSCENQLCVNPSHLYLSGSSRNMNGRIVDITGERYGRLTVIKYAGIGLKRDATWLCRCDCGKEKVFTSLHLRNGYSTSCGCIGHPNRRIDLSGKKSGKLTILKRDESRMGEPGGARWICLCECGEIRSYPAHPLKIGAIKSCGCIQRRTDQEVYYTKYKGNAEAKHREFSLTIDEFWNIVTQDCYLCGAHPTLRRTSSKGNGGHKIIVNGIDRMDNTKGYTVENSRPCCSMCNRSKMDHDLDKWRNWLRRAYKTQEALGVFDMDVALASAGISD